MHTFCKGYFISSHSLPLIVGLQEYVYNIVITHTSLSFPRAPTIVSLVCNIRT